MKPTEIHLKRLAWVLFMLIILAVDISVGIRAKRTAETHGTDGLGFQQITVLVFLDLRINASGTAFVTVTHKAADYMSWSALYMMYSARRDELASQMIELVVVGFSLTPGQLQAGPIVPDVYYQKLTMQIEADLSASPTCSIREDGGDVCLKDALQARGGGWIDGINVTVEEGLQIATVSPTSTLANADHRIISWSVPSLGTASDSYCFDYQKERIPTLWAVAGLAIAAATALAIFSLKRWRGRTEPPARFELVE